MLPDIERRALENRTQTNSIVASAIGRVVSPPRNPPNGVFPRCRRNRTPSRRDSSLRALDLWSHGSRWPSSEGLSHAEHSLFPPFETTASKRRRTSSSWQRRISNFRSIRLVKQRRNRMLMFFIIRCKEKAKRAPRGGLERKNVIIGWLCFRQSPSG